MLHKDVLYQCVVAHDKLEVCAAEGSLLFQGEKAGKVVLFVRSGQSHLTGSINSDEQFLQVE